MTTTVVKEPARNGSTPAAHTVSTRVVAICGTAGSSRREVMEQPPEVDLWGLNLSYDWMPRWSRWFEMHEPGIYQGVFTPAHREWLRKADVPIYMRRRDPEIPKSVEFPIDAVTEHGRYAPYFTSSIAYMIALAIHEGFNEIRLLGVNMAADSEYAYQRAACEYWIGIAEARGIKVYRPKTCPLLTGPLYGAAHPNADLVRAVVDKREGLKIQMEQSSGHAFGALRDLLKQHVVARRGHEGALEALSAVGAADQAAAVATAISAADAAFVEGVQKELDQLEIILTACSGAIQLADQLMAGQGATQGVIDSAESQP